MAFIAESEVVHRALTGGENAEGCEQGVGDGLAGFDIAGDDGGRIARVEHRALGGDNCQGAQATGVQWDVAIDQAAEDVEHGGCCDRARSVEVGWPLGAGAGEVDGGAA